MGLAKMSSNDVTVNATTGQVMVSEMPPLCGCCDDFFECHKAMCMPSIAVGEISEAIGQSGCGTCSCHAVLTMFCTPWVADCVHGCTTAQDLRKQYGLPADACSQACTHCWCGFCARSQELRLVKQIREVREAMVMTSPIRQVMGPSIVNITAGEC